MNEIKMEEFLRILVCYKEQWGAFKEMVFDIANKETENGNDVNLFYRMGNLMFEIEKLRVKYLNTR
jgi:hypothetical protein